MITIIVLLILAGITIAALSGDNGILQRVAEAKEKTSEAEKQEMQDIENMESTIEEYVAGIKVEQVTDAKPGELEVEETAENTYIINSIEDLVFFSHDVRNGNTYEGETVKLGLSLDFNSNKSYVDPLRTDYGEYGYNGELKELLTSESGFLPIGTTSNINYDEYSFSGIFDGNNKVISGLYMNKETINGEEMRIGLFANNNGIIKNLGIINGKITLNAIDTTVDIGTIAAKNYNTIVDCFCKADINIYAKESVTGVIRAGGLTSGNHLNIERCYHDGKINVYGENNTNTTIGGVCSSSDQKIIESYSCGSIEINANNKSVLQIGGIVGSDTGEIENCYNTKKIHVSSNQNTEGYVGGIAGNIQLGTINYCYNIGNVEIPENMSLMYSGSIVGQTGVNINNCFFLTGSDDKGVGHDYSSETLNHTIIMKSEDEMKSKSFIDILNQNNLDIWKEDTNNINNGYPILSWR